MLFLNKYGLDYHYTDRSKYKKLIQDKYNNIKIKPALLEYFARNKSMRPFVEVSFFFFLFICTRLHCLILFSHFHIMLLKQNIEGIYIQF